MKIVLAHIVDDPEQFGGAERVVLDLGRCFDRTPGVEVEAVVNPGLLREQLTGSGISSTVIRPRADGTRAVAADMRAAVAKVAPDVVHSHHRLATWMLASPRRRYALVQTLHVSPQSRRWLTHRGDLTVCVSEGIERDMRRIPLTPGRLVTIENGIDTARFANVRRSSASHVRFAAVGRLTEQKGYPSLIQAAAHLSAAGDIPFTLEIAGEGPARGSLEGLIAAHGLEGIVDLPGVRPAEEVFGRTDVLVMPSLWEGTPLVLLEAWASGLPVIATDIDGIREAARGVARLVEPASATALASAMRELAGSVETRNALAEAGRRLALDRYTIDRMGTRYMDAFQELLGIRGAA